MVVVQRSKPINGPCSDSKPERTQERTEQCTSASGQRATSSANKENCQGNQAGTSMEYLDARNARRTISRKKRIRLLNALIILASLVLFLISSYRFCVNLHTLIWTIDSKTAVKYCNDIQGQFALEALICISNFTGIYFITKKRIYMSTIAFGVIVTNCLIHMYHVLYKFKNWGYVMAFEGAIRDLNK